MLNEGIFSPLEHGPWPEQYVGGLSEPGASNVDLAKHETATQRLLNCFFTLVMKGNECRMIKG